MKRLLVVVMLIVASSGCSTYAAARYSISADNVRALRSFKGQTVNVGAFTAAKPGQTEITCRGVGPIKTPDGEPFEQFVRKAFIDELTIAEIYAPDAAVSLTGRLDAIDFSSGVGATWNIALTVASSNGRNISVTEDYRYTSSYFGETACNQTAQALMPAIQNLVGKVITHPEFQTLLR
jgi:hypothetical protein